MSININKDLCIGCGACTSVCPTGSLELNEDGKAQVNPDTCVDCGACVATCPVEAISTIDSQDEDEDYEDISIIHFYADWCGPCKMMEPELEIFKEENSYVDVVDVNIEENSKMASKYNVLSIPTCVILRNGEEVDRLVGFASSEQLAKAVNNL